MKARDGGDAFPSPGVVLMNEGGMPQQQGAYAGMSLRDYFAAKAMQGITSRGVRNVEGDIFEYVAAEAYRMADAMLNAREA